MSEPRKPELFDRIGYYTALGFLTATMLYSAGMYIFTPEEARAGFRALGYPDYLVFPLAIAKLLGLVAVWTRVSEVLKNLAYDAYFFNFMLAFAAHWMVRDGDYAPAVLATLFLVGTVVFEKRLFADR